MFFVALPAVTVSAFDKLPNTDVLVILRYIPLVLQNLAPFVLPLGLLLAAVSTYGRMAADNEWTALQMAGFHPLFMLLPGALIALVLSGTTHWLLTTQLPNLKKLERQFVLEAAYDSLMNLAPGRTNLQFGAFYLNAAFLDGDVLRDVYIHKPGLDGEKDVRAFAEAATIRAEGEGDTYHINLEEVRPVDPETGIAGRLERMTIVLPVARYFKERTSTYSSPRYWTNGRMREALAGSELSQEKRARFEFELHHRASTACAVLVFLGLGASTGLLLRRGTQLAALAVAVGYALGYYMLSMRLGKELVWLGALPPAVGAWATVSLGAVCGVVLLHRAMKR